MAETTKKWDVNYTPDFVQKAIAGGKGGKNGRPFIFDVRNFKIDTKDDGTKIGTYLLFGGVPAKDLHEKLESVGFKVRRRPRSYENQKLKKTVVITDRDSECYAVYYNTNEVPSEDQAALVAGLMFKALGHVESSGNSFLLSDWDAVNAAYGDDVWVEICSVEPEAKVAPAAAVAAVDTATPDAVEIPHGLF